jgi:hypothetical protein
MMCVLLLAVSGCGRGGKITVEPNSDSFKDGQYFQSLLGMGAPKKFETFLESCAPADRVKYINRSVEEGTPERRLGLKSAYERFANDPNPEVAEAAKEALSKVPSPEEAKK